MVVTRASTVRALHSFPTRRSSDLSGNLADGIQQLRKAHLAGGIQVGIHILTQELDVRISHARHLAGFRQYRVRSEEHTSELQSLRHLVCRLLLEKKKTAETKHADE